MQLQGREIENGRTSTSIANMMIGFKVANFRSFHAEEGLSFLASSDDSLEQDHCVRTRFGAVPRLTRTAVVFGANGAGKSNLIAALRVLKHLVLYSGTMDAAQFSRNYFPFHAAELTEAPTEFKIDLLLQGLRYQYWIGYTARRITLEELKVFRSSKSQRWFGRRFDAVANRERWVPFSPHFPGARQKWRLATQPTALFLTTAAALQANSLKPLLHWFEHQLDVSPPGVAIDLRPVASRLKESGYKRKVLRILRSVDMPIADVRVVPAPASADLTGPPLTRTPPRSPRIELLYSRPGLTPLWVDTAQDSSGTQRLLTLLSPLLDGIEQDRFVAIDEFDTHLHPYIARFLIGMINDPAFIHRHVQVLLTSHTTSLMDLEILRRDEFWLMELDRNAASRLKALLEFSPRRHENVSRSYLKGQYGAVPRLDRAPLRDVSEMPLIRTKRRRRRPT